MAPFYAAANVTTAKPTELFLKCPFFTHGGYNSETNQYFCDYQPWAYGLFAIACLLVIMVPLVLIICCVVRSRHKRRFERRLRSTLSSNTSYSSSEVPYQPLTRENRKNYGTIEQEGTSTSRFFPNEESISEAPSSQQQDNASTTSSKASMYPNYDQASLDFRNASALNAPRNSSQNSKNDISPYASTKLVADSISQSKDVPSKAKSPIYAVLEEPSPKEPSLGSREQESFPPELKTPENNVNVIAEDDKENVENNEQLPKDTDEEKKPVVESLDDLYTLPEVNYALNKEPNSTPQQLEPSSTDSGSRGSSPVYNVLEPPLPNVPELEKNPETTVEKQFVDDNIPRDDTGNDSKLSAECTDTPEETYTPLLLPRERPSSTAASDDTDSGVYQALMPKQRERLTSRADYEEFLLEMIQSLPEEERNGAFLVRDSVTDPGSKALTVYNKSMDSEKEVFNFKVCFNDEREVYLAKSTKRFSSLEALLQYLRTNKDMLPCTLKSQVI